MIGSFKDGQNGELAAFYVHGTRSAQIPAIIEKPLRRKLSLRGLTLSGTKTHVKQRFLPLTPLLMVSDVLWSPVLPA